MKKQNVKYFLASIISLITFAVYLPALGNEFIEFDDITYIVENPYIRSFSSTFFEWAFFDFYAGNWHPLAWISHACDYSIWGLDPLGHHLTGIVLHAVNTFLVVILVIRLMSMMKKRTARPLSLEFLDKPTIFLTAGVAGFLFGLHPVHVESVAWAAERKDLLCALFFLLSVMMYAQYADGQENDDGKETSKAGINSGIGQKFFFMDRRYLFSLGFFVLALMSKPMAVSLPAVLLILDWCPLQRIKSLKTFQNAFLEKLPFVTLSLFSSILTILAQRAGGAIQSSELFPLSKRLLVAVHSLVMYLWHMALPLNLIPYYPYPKNASLASFEYIAAIALAAGITAICVLLVGKQKVWLTAWGYYVISLIPVLGIVQVGGQAMADRYTYLPSLGPFIIIGLSAAWMLRKLHSLTRERLIVMSISGAVIIMLVFMAHLTIKQIGIWKNSLSLMNYIIEKEPGKVFLAYLGRANIFYKTGQRDRAIVDYSQAIALNPSLGGTYSNRGAVLGEIGEFDQAIADFNKAIHLNPSYYQAYYNRAIVFDKMGNFSEAIEDLDKAISLRQGFWEAFYYRAAILDKTGRSYDALENLDKAILIKQNHPLLYLKRGELHLRTGDKSLAAADFKNACNLGNENGCKALRTVGH